MNIDHEIELLVKCLQRISEPKPDGTFVTTFGKASAAWHGVCASQAAAVQGRDS